MGKRLEIEVVDVNRDEEITSRIRKLIWSQKVPGNEERRLVETYKTFCFETSKDM